MDDNYLDKKLKDILQSGSQFEPDAAAMHDMQKRLRVVQPAKKNRYGLPILLSILLLFLLSSLGLTYKKQMILSQQVQDLNHQMSQITQQDSIINSHIIYQIDTIYQVVYQQKHVSSPGLSVAKLPFFTYHPTTPFITSNSGQLLGQTLNTDTRWSLTKNGLSLLDIPSGSSFFESATQEKQDLPEAIHYTSLLEPLTGPSLKKLAGHNSTNPSLLSKIDYDFLTVRKNKVKPAYYFIPSGFTAELNASPLLFPTHDFGGSAYSFGAKGSVELPQGRALEVGVELLNMDFELKDNPEKFSIFPVANPNDPTDVLHELKGNLRYVQIPVSIRQRFMSNRKFRPSVALGLVAYRPLRQRFVYEYIDATDEYKLENTFTIGSFSVDNIRVALGFEYSLGNRISIEPELQYQSGSSLNANEYFKLRFWAGNIGLKYKIK